MNVFVFWLTACRKKCVALFASKGAGTFLKTKSVKREGSSKGAAVRSFVFIMFIINLLIINLQVNNAIMDIILAVIIPIISILWVVSRLCHHPKRRFQ